MSRQAADRFVAATLFVYMGVLLFILAFAVGMVVRTAVFGHDPIRGLRNLPALERERGWLLTGTAGEPVVVPKKDVPQVRKLAAASGQLTLRRYECVVHAPDQFDAALVSQPYSVRLCTFEEDTP